MASWDPNKEAAPRGLMVPSRLNRDATKSCGDAVVINLTKKPASPGRVARASKGYRRSLGDERRC
jgi:hypothetical protein